ncbi:hypothetical protein SAMN05444678_1322 [Sphingomonas sp. YR710]|nr:hypothetical protein SAMN05444678_1322 [Sphingomonas sp. YR710]
MDSAKFKSKNYVLINSDGHARPDRRGVANHWSGDPLEIAK